VAPVRFSRAVLCLAALDWGVTAAWLLARPADLLRFLQAAPSGDALLLLRLLGALTLAQGAFLALAAFHRGPAAGLLAPPLFGRALQAGLWLWLLGADRAALPAGPLLLLLAHDAFWLAALAALLGIERWRAGG
jgi:hypothetical protein